MHGPSIYIPTCFFCDALYMSINKRSLASVNAQIATLDKTKEVNIDIVSEILSFTKDIYNVYMRADERLQKKFISFFFDRFEVKDGIIIKYCYTPLFEGLMQEKAVTYKTHESEKPIDNNVSSDFIINPKLGPFRPLISLLVDWDYMEEVEEKVGFIVNYK